MTSVNSIARAGWRKAGRWGVLLASATALLGLGCASVAGEPDYLPRGPGSVFDSVDDAAFDALHHAASRPASRRVEYGGTIYATERGFSYGAPLRGTADDVSVDLGTDDIAWYYTHGRRRSPTLNLLNESPSDRDRHMVDRIDPRHRPMYLLTPSGQVVVYRDGTLAAVAKPTEHQLAGTR
jgi:hypothetical protein